MEKQSKKSWLMGLVGLIVVAAVVVVIILVVNNNSSKTLTPAQQTSAKQQIEANWQDFFAYATSQTGRQNLLQNGGTFSQVIKTEFTSLATAKSSAVISSVKFPSKTTANVVYSVDLNGQPVLTNQNGQALLINNVWEVSDGTLCNLLKQSGNSPTICKSY